MITPLKSGTAGIVKATIPALEAHGVEITKTMYGALMRDPAIAAMFNQTDQANGRQPHALAAAVLAYARHIEHPERLEAALSLITERHVAVMVKPEQYPVVGRALLGAIKTVLGDAATPEIIDAWADAYRFLADVLIDREARIYAERAALPGGWREWRTFRVASKTKESDAVASFWLVPVDGKPVLRHEPGQFLTFRLDRDGLSTRRSYSISSAPDSSAYRISVKRDPLGKVSRWFHDVLKEGDALDVAPPAGDFTLARSGTSPVILVSAGIGITPFMSMILAAGDRKSSPAIRLVHGDHDFARMAFKSTFVDAATKPEACRIDLFSSSGEGNNLPVPSHKGHISAQWIFDQMGADTHVFVCGPRGFQRDLIGGLRQLGVPGAQLHHEFFGSDEPLLG
ncbi:MULTISPECIES: globin domain-containing protein [Asaia]|uniref:globin domain-containing protein n=1 Tax=Asaia TaxID=91914 RepID=UPI002557365A|nr:globin domain-containing protein [Asaia sp. HumB]MDL2171319.1 FAD-binding oxidoreductase [Asaia sp. HumB]